jgi:hypothetical protein
MDSVWDKVYEFHIDCNYATESLRVRCRTDVDKSFKPSGVYETQWLTFRTAVTSGK